MPERPGGAPFINGLPQSVIDRYERSQKTAAKEHGSDEWRVDPDTSLHHLSPYDIPVYDRYGEHKGQPKPHPYAVSEDDAPARYPGRFHQHASYTLTHVPIHHLISGKDCPEGKHGEACYRAENLDKGSCGDNMSEGRPGDDDFFNDAWTVQRMARKPEELPALIADGSGQMFGGGHRTAAWAEAGWTHAPIWMPDMHVERHRTAARSLPETEIGPLYHGTTEERAQAILEHGFTDSDRHGSVVHLSPHPDLAMRYAQSKGGHPVVLRIERVRGVSGHEVGYMDPDRAREAGAHFQDKGPEVLVLDTSRIEGISRHA